MYAVKWQTFVSHQFTTALRFVLKKLETQAQTFAPGLCLIIAGGIFLLNNFIFNGDNLDFPIVSVGQLFLVYLDSNLLSSFINLKEK